MNKVLWLRGQASFGKIFKIGSKQRKKLEQHTEQGSSVFIALPSYAPKQAPEKPRLTSAPNVLVAMPLKGYHESANAVTSLKRKSFISAAALSFICFVGVIFVAIGVLNLMIRSFRLQAYTQGYMVLEQAAHKPGAGPAPQDAVINEYQHALTREMVAAADTSLVITAGKTVATKGMLEQITVSEEMPGTGGESGTNRKINIHNGTERKLDRVVVQIDVLDMRGHLLRTEYQTARGMAPSENRVVSLDSAATGAELRFYVQEVRSKSLRTSLRSL